MKLEKIAKKTLSDEVFDQLSSQIVFGSLSPGVILPSERELVETLGVNRGAVREALRRLAQAGLIRISQGGGTKVLDYRRTAGLDLLARLLVPEAGGVDLSVARSIMEMRAALAPDIARLAARRADDALAEELSGIAEAMAAHVPPEETVELSGAASTELPDEALDALQSLSLRFWDALVRGSGNVAYELSFNSLRTVYDEIRGALVHVMADEVRDVDSHRAIALAVGRRDELSAKHVAAGLMERGTRRVFELIAALEGGESGAANRSAAPSAEPSASTASDPSSEKDTTP